VPPLLVVIPPAAATGTLKSQDQAPRMGYHKYIVQHDKWRD